jgi:ankyrin repeat protein
MKALPVPLRSGLALALAVSLAGACPAADEPIVRLAKAVEEGDVATVRRLIAEGADPNERVPSSDLGRTPLFLAVEADRPEVTEALLKAGADPAIEDENGDPVIFMATDAGRIPHARLLVAHGVPINSRNRAGDTVLMRGMMHVDPPDFQAKIDLGADVNLVDARGESALMLAAAAGNLAAVETFIDAGAKLDLRNREGRTALMIAASRDTYGDKQGVTPRIVELLIKGGADLNQRDEAGRSALMLALESWTVKQETLDVLLAAKPDPGFRDKEGRDALFLAVQDEDRKACVEPLIALGADLKTSDLEGVDLLMLAAANADPGQVRGFLERGLSPERRSEAGEMAVHHAAGSQGPRTDDPFLAVGKDAVADHGRRVAEVLHLLHGKGASLIATDGHGATPLHLAAGRGTPEAVAYLLPHFSDPDLTDAERWTPLHHAARGGSAAVIDLLLARSPDLNARNAAGQTPLWIASAGDHGEAVKRLASARADLDAMDGQGSTALAHAIDSRQFEQARLLLELGADPKRIADPSARLLMAARQFHDHPLSAVDYAFPVELFAGLADHIDRRDADGMTALMWVAASNVQPAVEAMLKRGPDLDARSSDGRSALMWAAASGAVDSMKALGEAGADASLRDPGGRSAADWLAWSVAEHPAAGPVIPAGAESLLERKPRPGEKPAPED